MSDTVKTFGLIIDEAEDTYTYKVIGYDDEDTIPMGSIAKTMAHMLQLMAQYYLSMLPEDLIFKGPADLEEEYLQGLSDSLFSHLADMPLLDVVGLLEDAGERDINPFLLVLKLMQHPSPMEGEHIPTTLN